MADYYYLHEKPKLLYTVLVKPPPADSSKADFHKGSPSGSVFHVEPELKRQGSGELPFDLAAHGATLDFSPIFVEFTFRKNSVRPPERKVLAVLSLAEPEVRAIEAPPEAGPGEDVKVFVTAWSALAYDQPRVFSVFDEERPGRISVEHRSKVRWKVDGKDLPIEGEKVKLPIEERSLGGWVELEAWLTGKLPSRASARIAVPKLTISGPATVRNGETIALEARIEPTIEGTSSWSLLQGDKVEVAKSERPGCGARGLKKSAAERDSKVRCTFTSKATGKKYHADHEITVTEALGWIEIDLVDDGGSALANEPFEIALPDGSKRQGKLDAQGHHREENLPIGALVTVTFPERDFRVPEFGEPPEEVVAVPAAVDEDWIEIELRDDAGAPLAHEPFVLELADGTKRRGVLDGEGRFLVEHIPPGAVRVTFPERDFAEARVPEAPALAVG